jgi:hypothetical protein
MDKVVLRQVILRVLRFSPVTVSPSVFHTHIHFSTTINRRTSGKSRGTFKQSRYRRASQTALPTLTSKFLPKDSSPTLSKYFCNAALEIQNSIGQMLHFFPVPRPRTADFQSLYLLHFTTLYLESSSLSLPKDRHCLGTLRPVNFLSLPLLIKVGYVSQEEEDSFHQQTGLKFKEETSKVLHLEHSFVWC